MFLDFHNGKCLQNSGKVIILQQTTDNLQPNLLVQTISVWNVFGSKQLSISRPNTSIPWFITLYSLSWLGKFRLFFHLNLLGNYRVITLLSDTFKQCTEYFYFTETWETASDLWALLLLLLFELIFENINLVFLLRQSLVHSSEMFTHHAQLSLVATSRRL